MKHKTVQITDSLPDYLVADVNNLNAIENTTLRKVAPPVKFPLSDDDRRDITKLVLKFENEKDIAGLAAPQIGISKRIIEFKGRIRDKDNNMIPQQTWINPSYEKIDDKMVTDYEACFSVKGMTGPVKRYKRVLYRAFTTCGKLIEGVVKGLVARVVQHEIDHLNGILFIDLVPQGLLTPNL